MPSPCRFCGWLVNNVIQVCLNYFPNQNNHQICQSVTFMKHVHLCLRFTKFIGFTYSNDCNFQQTSQFSSYFDLLKRIKFIRCTWHPVNLWNNFPREDTATHLCTTFWTLMIRFFLNRNCFQTCWQVLCTFGIFHLWSNSSLSVFALSGHLCSIAVLRLNDAKKINFKVFLVSKTIWNRNESLNWKSFFDDCEKRHSTTSSLLSQKVSTKYHWLS